MKTLAIILLGAVLVYGEIRETAFRPRREYSYEYEGQVLTGLPKTSKEHSGLKIKCKVALQFQSDDDKVIMQLDEVSLYRLQKQVDDPRKQQPLEEFQEVTGDEAEIFKTELRKAVRFTYRQGKVGDIETSRDEPLWSVNSKRGIMNMLQLNLNERESLDLKKNINRPTSSRKDGEMSLLRVMEEGISGNCESQYEIKFDKTEVRTESSSELRSTNVMNITKIRDLENCEERKRMQKSILSGFMWRQDMDEKKRDELIKSLSQIRFNVTGDQDEFMIESAVSEGQHVFSLYKDDVSNVVTFVNQRLTLKKTDRIVDEIEMPRDTKEQGRIMYEFPEEKQLREKSLEEIQRQEQTPTTRRVASEDAKTLLNMIVDYTQYEVIPEQVPSHLVYMVQKLRHLNKDDINDIYQEVVERTRDSSDKREERKRKIFLDALPLINTRESFKMIKEKIENRKIEGEMASQILSTIAVIHDPSIQTLDDVLELCKHPDVVDQKDVRKTCWLSFGAMIHNALSETKKTSRVQTQIRELEKQIEQERRQPMTQERRYRTEDLEQRLRKAKDDVEDAKKRYRNNLVEGIKAEKPKEEQKMCLKAIANSGLKDTVQDVQNIIESRVDDEIKVTAIYSLRRIAPQIPSKVRNILIPVYHDQENSPEVRIAAFTITMDSNVTSPVLQLFAQSLHKERSQQVGSYVYAYLKSKAKSSSPVERKKAIACEYALRFAKPITPGAQYSKHVQMDKQLKDMHMGFATEVNTIGTLESVMPRAANAKVSANILGYNMNLFETGFRAEGLQTIADKIVGPSGSFWRKSSVLDLLKSRRPRSVPVVDKEKRQLRESLPIESRQLEEPKGSVYFKMFGNELRFLTFDKDTLRSVLEEGKITIKDIEDKLKELRSTELQKALMLAETTYQIPTEMGLPLQANVTSGAFVNVKVEGRATVFDALFESKREGKDPEAVVAEADINTKVAMDIEGRVGVDAHVLKTGVAVRASVNSSIPVNFRINFDLKTKKFETHFKTLEKEQQLVSIKSRPFTWSLIGERKPEQPEERQDDSWSRLWSRYTEPEQKKGEERKRFIHGDLIKDQPTEKKYKTGRDVGVEFEVSTKHVSSENKPEAPKYPFTGPMELNITVRPGDRRPDDVKITITYEEEEKQENEEHIERHTSRQSISGEEGTWDWKSASYDSRRDSRRQSGSSSERKSGSSSWRKSGSSSGRKSDSFESGSDSRREEPRQAQSTKEDHLTRPIKTKKITLRMTGEHIENPQYNRQILAELTLDTEERKYKSFHLEIIKSQDQSEDDTKMCVQGEVEYPEEQIDTLQKLYTHWDESRQQESNYRTSPRFYNTRQTSVAPREIRAKLSTQWGKSCENDKKVQFKFRVEKTKEQLREERERKTPEYEQCEQDRRDNKEYSHACMEILRKITELRKVNVEITHEKLPKWAKSLYSKTIVYAEYYWWNHLKLDNVEIDNPYNKVYFTAELTDKMNVANITVNHPYENLKFEKVRMPIRIQPMSTRKTMVQQYMNLYMNDQWTPYCKVRSNDEIKTFDNVTYKYALSKCEHIIAEDCSQENRFTVLASKIHETSEKKIAKIFIEDTKVEMIPREDNDQITVRINGEQKDLRPNEKMIVRKEGEVEFRPVEETVGKMIERTPRVESGERRPSRSSEERTEQDRRVTEEECSEIKERYDNGQRLTSEEEEKREMCRCREIEARYYNGDYVSSQEMEERRECQRRPYRPDQRWYESSEEDSREESDSRERQRVSESECQELRQKEERGELRTEEEERKYRQCRCRDVMQKRHRGDELDSREREEYEECRRGRPDQYRGRKDWRYETVKVDSKEVKYWEDLEDMIHRAASGSRERQVREWEQTDENKNNPIIAIIIRHADERIELISQRVGIQVKTDGKNIQVKLSSFYRMKHCGLCGKFDGERENEFEGPQKEIYRSGHEFGLSYQVPSEKCTENIRCLPRMKTLVQERTIDGTEMSCFSKTAVARCGEECRKDEVDAKTVDFHCLEKALQSTRDLVDRSRSEVINKISSKRTDFRDDVEIHRRCRQ